MTGPSAAPSLRRRLAIGLSLAVATFWLAAAGIAGLVIRHELDELFDSALQEVVQRVLPLAYAEILARDADDAVEQKVPDAGRHDEHITYVVRDGQGRILLQSHDADPARFPADLKVGFEDRGDTRFFTESAVKGTLTVSAAERRGHRAGAVRKLMLALVLPLGLLLPAIIAATFWLVRRGVRPVSDFGAALAARGGGDLSPVADSGLPQEIRPVGAAVNALMERLRRALEAERSFTANSAHELRTPVAGALAQVQRLMAETGQGNARLTDIESALRRLSRLTEKLLQLAKADGGALLTGTPQDLGAVVPFVLADIPGAGRVTVSAPRQPLLSRLDIDVFAITLRNLVENALKHGAPDAPVSVHLDPAGVLTVINRGPVLSQQAFARLRQRFEQGSAREDGAGLGLAIVDAIARGAGSTFEMISPAPGLPDGVAMRLSLPLS